MYIYNMLYTGILRQHSLNARWYLVSISFIDLISMSRNNFRTFPLINFVMNFDIQRAELFFVVFHFLIQCFGEELITIIRETENLQDLHQSQQVKI